MKREILKRTGEAIALATIVFIGGVSCAGVGNTTGSATPGSAIGQENGEAPAGATRTITFNEESNIRFDAAVKADESTGDNNICATAAQGETFTVPEGSIVETLGDINGPWIGYPAESVPGGACADDQDGIVYTAQSLVTIG